MVLPARQITYYTYTYYYNEKEEFDIFQETPIQKLQLRLKLLPTTSTKKRKVSNH